MAEYDYVNCTPHAITVAGIMEDVTYPPSGKLARVSQTWTMNENGFFQAAHGPITGLPEPEEGVKVIVSAMVQAANEKQWKPREDLVTPATGHPDVKRDDSGQIKSVPGFCELALRDPMAC